MSAPALPGQQGVNVSQVEAADSKWKGLCRVGGAAALLIGVFYIIEIIVVATTGVPPSTTIAWFTLLQNNRLLGLFDLFPLDIVSAALVVPVFLALYVILRRSSQSWTAIATVLVIVGSTDLFATNTAFSMLSLSNQYAAATSDAQKSLLLALGQQLLPANQSTGAFMAYTLSAIAGIIISAVMLRNHVFGRSIAYVGILGNALEAVPFVPAYYVAVVIGLGGVLLVVWYLLIARRLFQLGRDANVPAIRES
jgi:hypothetical protein